MKRVTWAPKAVENYSEQAQAIYSEMRRAERLAETKRKELIDRCCGILKQKYQFVSTILPLPENFEFEDFGFFVKSMVLNGEIETLIEGTDEECPK